MNLKIIMQFKKKGGGVVETLVSQCSRIKANKKRCKNTKE